MTTGLPDVRVRRCTVRVRRRGGWSWGDPADYVDEIVTALEQTVEALMGEAGVPRDATLTLEAPLALEVGRDGRPTATSLAAAAQVLRAAAATARRESLPDMPLDTAADEEPRPATEAVETQVGDVGSAAATAVVAALARWSRMGTLSSVLASWPARVLDAWAAAVAESARVAGVRTAGLSSAAVTSIAGGVVGEESPTVGADASRRFLLVAGAVAAALGDEVVPDERTLATVAEVSGAPLPWRRDVATDGAHTPATPAPGPRPAAASGQRGAAPVAIVPALPFLALVQLHRLAYTEAAVAAVAATGVTRAASAFAAVAAGATLDPPAHGWRRRPEERRAVELSSGLSPAEVDAALSACAERAALLHVPLRNGLAELYAAARGRNDPLELTRVGDELVCGEARGWLPVAWCGSRAELDDVLALLGRPPVLESDLFAPVAAALRDHRAFPGRAVPDLERVMRAVVGTALGTLAQELWGGSADAVLALERLRDLEARVETGDRVRIGIPRGQRWLDLRRIGLIDAWAAPWAPGGVWEIVTW